MTHKKEPINMERCKQDLQAQRKEELWCYVGDFFLLTFLLGTLSGCFAILGSELGLTGAYWISGLLWIPPFAYIVGSVCFWIRSGKRIRAMKPTLVRTTLSSIGVMELTRHERDWHLRRIKKRPVSSYFDTDSREYQSGYWYDPFVFYFPEGRYVLPGRNFKWSKSHSMSAKGLEHFASPGDEFYLLIAEAWRGKKKQKIVYAFPASIFDWQDENIQE